jgi:fermentation-respiration switch protein FrsA (DUF1100 family)
LLPALWLVLAAVLSLPPLLYSWTLLTSTSFLVEFLSGGQWRPLSAITADVTVRPLPATSLGRQVAVDLYARVSVSRAPGLVLVHGLSPSGKDDPRLREAASLLARAGWAVAVPTVDGLTVLRLRPEDAAAVVASIRALSEQGQQPVSILAVSVGAGPALLAAADPGVSSSVSAVLVLGGYASAVELLRYTLTGAYEFDGLGGRRPVNEAAIAQFARANAELVDAMGRRLVDNRDPRALDALIGALPDDTRRLLNALSPATHVGRIRAPLFLIHGRDDPAVPFTESRRLDRAARVAGLTVRTVVVGALGHVEPEHRARSRDLVGLGAAFYAFDLVSRGRGSLGLTWAGRAP